MSGLYLKHLFGSDGFVILTEGKVPGHLTRLDDHGILPREYATLFTAAPDLLEALEGILRAETYPLHVGYDNGSGGGNYLWADAVRLDDEAFTKARAAIAKVRGEKS